uniref:Cdc42 effector protein 1-like n=1 Tax=Gouania willdenowi TaxID=441366 RepID=A0A8C5GMI5_GOUWI
NTDNIPVFYRPELELLRDLTVDMISPPLGDFRHTMHVGRGGDVFGDTSFLSNHGGTANANNADTEEASKDLSPPPPAVSPIIKNAISLPRLDVDWPNGSPTTKVLFPSSQSTPEEHKSTYGELVFNYPCSITTQLRFYLRIWRTTLPNPQIAPKHQKYQISFKLNDCKMKQSVNWK